MVRFLVDHGADINAMAGMSGDALRATVRMFTECFRINHVNNEALIRIPLDAGDGVIARFGWEGVSLIEAARTCNPVAVELLLDYGADIEARATHNDDLNALLVAVGCDRKDVACLLINRGADVNARAGDRNNAHCIAAFAAREDMTRMGLM